MDKKILVKNIVDEFFREDFNRALLVTDNLKQIINIVKEKYKLNAIYLTDALSSIINEGVLNHLASYRAKTRRMKGFHNALWEYSENKISKENLHKIAKQSIRRSIITNTRNAYQSWVLLSLLNLVNCKLLVRQYNSDTNGYEFKYIDELPDELKYISLESQRDYKGIHPNFALEISGRFFSIFYEGPGIIEWNLYSKETDKTFWKLYGAPRPDIMIYSGQIDNIYSPSVKPFPIMKPDIIIECKEEGNWYKKLKQRSVYDGAKDWRNAAIESREQKKEKIDDLENVKEYLEIYSPKNLFLVSWKETPNKTCEELINSGITCINKVNFDKDKLIKIVETIKQSN